MHLRCTGGQSRGDKPPNRRGSQSCSDIRRQLKRRSVLAFFQKLPPCLVGIEACASSHHWSRELQALGHAVRLMPPAELVPPVGEKCYIDKRGQAPSGQTPS